MYINPIFFVDLNVLGQHMRWSSVLKEQSIQKSTHRNVDVVVVYMRGQHLYLS